MQKNGVDMQRVGDLARMLTGGPAEAAQGETTGVIAPLHRNLLDGVSHLLHGDAQEACRQLRWRHRPGRGRAYLVRQSLKSIAHDLKVERLVAPAAKDGREEIRLDAAQQQVGIRNGQRAAIPIACGARKCAG